MMQSYKNYQIQEAPLGSSFFHREVEHFLSENGLRLENLDAYYTIRNDDGTILAGAGVSADVVKCVAVAEGHRSEGLLAPLISHIISEKGGTNLKVFTKPEYRTLFQSLGFKLLAQAPKAILLEKGRGLEQYCSYLSSFRRPGSTGVVIMNANPFTLGHRYLLEQASSKVDNLFVIAVSEEASRFPYRERLEMLRKAAPQGVTVLEGSAYQISSATFPTYFLKDLSQASNTQMLLDLDLFGRWIAPALGASVRFVGSEPSDALTAQYNALMKEVLPIEVVEIQRLEDAEGPVSASRVRELLSAGKFNEAKALTPESTWPFLLADLATNALQAELDTPGKPGLVGPDSCGAHKDMDYKLMQKGISALRPYWPMMAVAPTADALVNAGLEAEKAMLEATGGVNTHKGAIFALGLALNCVVAQGADNEKDMQNGLCQIAQAVSLNNQRDNNLRSTPGAKAEAEYGIKGARGMALDGYRQLFADWLPFYRTVSNGEGFSSASLRAPIRAKAPEKPFSSPFVRTLLRIMSNLDDTCVIHRVGIERAAKVKQEAAQLLDNYSEENLERMCAQYAAEGISPGGAADMLSLTLLLNTIIN